jgi:predicted TIM-barrel fold metal-dependent hydrolase
MSAINWLSGPHGRERFHAFLKTVIERGYGKRMMFGSDAMGWPDAISLAVESVDSAPFLTQEQKADIFHDNAVRFFRLTSPVSAE